MTELQILQRSDDRVRQIAGLYAAEKNRADKLEIALREILKRLPDERGGDLAEAIEQAQRILNPKKG